MRPAAKLNPGWKEQYRMSPKNNSPAVRPRAPVAVAEILPLFDWGNLLTGISRGKIDFEYGVRRNIFVQGQPADSVYFLLRGKVQLSVTSSEGKEAIVATLGPGEFFGEGCLAGQAVRMATATSVEDCTLSRVEKATVVRMIHDQPGVAQLFVTHLLTRNIRYESDLVDQLFNSSEKRLARILLLLSRFTEQSKSETVAAGINQENLAQMVGTTRSRISHFMNKFRKLGFIEYENGGDLTVQRGLLSVVLQDQ
jgi:CRP-like cAMP-binding protein